MRQREHLWIHDKLITRDIVIVELLFATRLRISELCNLEKERFNINDGI